MDSIKVVVFRSGNIRQMMRTQYIDQYRGMNSFFLGSDQNPRDTVTLSVDDWGCLITSSAKYLGSITILRRLLDP